MGVSEDEIKSTIAQICQEFNWQVTLKPFQHEFMVKAVAGLSGFVEAPCGAGKSLLYQLLPFVLKRHRFPEIEHPIVIVVEPLNAISNSQNLEQKVPSTFVSEGGYFTMMNSDNELRRFPLTDVDKLSLFSGIVYSSPEVWDGSVGMAFKLHFSGRITAICIDEADKINLWGEGFREGYTRLGLLKPFLADGASTYFFTATATEEDKKVACKTLNVKDELSINICKYRGEFIKSVFRPNSSHGWGGTFSQLESGEYKFQPGLRQLIMKDYLEPFFEDPGNYPVTILLFRDQFHLGQTAEILNRRLGYQPPDVATWIQFHGLVDSTTLAVVFSRFVTPSEGYKLILMTSKGLCGTHIADVERCVMIRPLSKPHDFLQLMGRGGRGPSVWRSSLEVVWNNSDISHNVPGMTASVRNILDPKKGCIARNLCDIFSYQFPEGMVRCCSYCEV